VSNRFPQAGRGSAGVGSGHPAAFVADAAPPVLIVDSNQCCVEANEPATRLLGLDRSQIVGRSIDSLRLPERHLLVLPRIEDGPAPGPRAKRKGGPAAGAPRGRRPSQREREVLALLAQGSTDVQIAELLNLSPATVQTHVRNAKSKLGARTRAQAVALALVGGLIDV
jgi:DNA-binding CsgD family transcriptional regulator